MKKNYEKPEVELEKFQVEDVLSASTGDDKDGFTPSQSDDMDMGM